MVNALEAPAEKLILKLARHLKENVVEVTPPDWSLYVKTGRDRESPSIQDDWWYIRAASIMRKLYKASRPLGVERFRVIYGGYKNRGSRPEHYVRAGGAIPRTILKQLENAGLAARVPGKGRILTPKAVSLMDKIAYELLKDMSREAPELKKYLE